MLNSTQQQSNTYADMRHALDEVKGKSADYSWLWNECRGTEPVYVAFERLRKHVDPDRPYFFGELSNGIRFAADARDFPAALHALYPRCNSILINGLIENVGEQAGDVIDVGANIGVVAASLGRHLGTRGHVYSFEPSPTTFLVAAATIALNGIENVTLTQAAIGDTVGDIPFQMTPGNSAIASAVKHNFPFLNEWQEIVVPCQTLDSFLGATPSRKVLLIKIDVEGFELNVIRGARETIRKFMPTIVYEYTPIAATATGLTEAESIALLSAVGHFRFEALLEPSIDDLPTQVQRVPFPLPEGLQNQVNVFAVPVENP